MRQVFNVLVTWTVFFIESSPGGLIFGFLLLFLLENLEPIQLREKEPFHQVRPDVPEVIGDPYGRDITNTTASVSV
jgi:hypothetical protein